ncbi:MAG: hypothetical protein ABI726_05730 [bacterium]
MSPPDYDQDRRPRWRTRRGWKSNMSKLEATFGQNDKPVDVKPGKTYRFRARSEKSAKPDKHSGWSPGFKVDVEP